MAMFEVKFSHVSIMIVRVDATSAAEVRRRIYDSRDSYADDLRDRAQEQVETYRISSVTPVR